MGLLNFAFFGTEAFVPLAIADVRGASIWLTGLSLTAAALTWTAGAWMQVRLAKRVAPHAVIVAGLVILGAGIGGVIALLSSHVPPWSAVVAWAVAGLGMGLAFTTCSAAILESAPAGQEGAASASLQLAQVLGAAVATGIGGAIVAAPFAGCRRRARDRRVADGVMLVVLVLAIATARWIERARDSRRPSDRDSGSIESARLEGRCLRVRSLRSSVISRATIGEQRARQPSRNSRAWILETMVSFARPLITSAVRPQNTVATSRLDAPIHTIRGAQILLDRDLARDLRRGDASLEPSAQAQLAAFSARLWHSS